MNSVISGLIWAAAMLAIAVVARLGLLSHAGAADLLPTLTALAGLHITVTARKPCLLRKGAR